MIFFKSCDFVLSDSFVHIRVNEADRNICKPFLSRLKIGDSIGMTLNVEGTFENTETGGIIVLRQQSSQISLGKHYLSMSRKQLNTIKAMERLLFFIDNKQQPSESELQWYHDCVMDVYGPRYINPYTGTEHIKSLSSPDVSSLEAHQIIGGIFNELATKDIPTELLGLCGDDLSRIFMWYEGYKSVLYSKGIFDSLNKDDYFKINPVCEFTLKPGNDFDPIERIHIISKGADISAYEESWNYLAGKRSIHHIIHTRGWEEILKQFPHIKSKYKRAHEMASKEKKDA